MVPTQWNSRLSLLLVLGLLGMTTLVHAPPPGITPAQWFVIQHINMTSNICNIAMQAINRYNYFHRICKNQNTFLHIPLSTVAQVCRGRNITCLSGLYTNCHSSPLPVSITNCILTRPGRRHTLCQYHNTNGLKNYDVACNNYYHPVHLDKVY
ncbi:non-secretory ribonuclease-like [Sturnira hondurensis]|uniref:non-secretory ribonuclease-like n=1 Tax=Sturnira hondurensis TaxID=192404 RepID=UPI00187AC577|nr:non-secretory ribonuclease-like [Sturnira hondurensis]